MPLCKNKTKTKLFIWSHSQMIPTRTITQKRPWWPQIENESGWLVCLAVTAFLTTIRTTLILVFLQKKKKEGRPNSLIKLHQDFQINSPINDVHNLVLWSTGASLKFKSQKLDLYYFCSYSVHRLYPGIWHWGDALGCAVVLVYRRLAEVSWLTQGTDVITFGYKQKHASLQDMHRSDITLLLTGRRHKTLSNVWMECAVTLIPGNESMIILGGKGLYCAMCLCSFCCCFRYVVVHRVSGHKVCYTCSRSSRTNGNSLDRVDLGSYAQGWLSEFWKVSC